MGCFAREENSRQEAIWKVTGKKEIESSRREKKTRGDMEGKTMGEKRRGDMERKRRATNRQESMGRKLEEKTRKEKKRKSGEVYMEI